MSSHESVSQWFTTPDHHHQHHHYAYAIDRDVATSDDGKNREASSCGAWAVGLFACHSSSLHLLTTALFPWVSDAYAARAIGKFLITVGIALEAFYYGMITFVALAMLTIDDDQQPIVTFMGMTLAIWKLGVLWTMLLFAFVVLLLRGWVRQATGSQARRAVT